MKKKILFILLLGVVVVGLVGCAKTENNSETKKVSKNSLAAVAKVGDYVDYKVESDKSYVSPADKSGYTKDQTFETTGEEKWRVMTVNKDGTVDLLLDGYAMTNIDKAFYLNGKLGIKNYDSELKNIADIYLNSKYAKSSRILSRDDVEGMLDLDETVKYFLKTYDSESSLYTRDENIDTSGSRKDVFESINKTYYSYIDKFSYGKTITFNNEKITFNARFHINHLKDCITNDDYKDLLDETWNVWLTGDAEALMGHHFNWNLDYVTYSLPKLTYSSETNSYKLETSSLYTLYLKGNEDSYTMSEEDEDSAIGNIKPIVTLKSNVKLDGGNGSSEDPYILK